MSGVSDACQKGEAAPIVRERTGFGSPSRFLPILILLISISVLPGCQFGHHPPPALQNPGAKISIEEFSGSVLSGPLAQSVEQAELTTTWSIQAHVLAVTSLPTQGFYPAGPLARLIINDGGGDLIAPSARLTYTARIRNLNPNEPFDPAANDPSRQVNLGSLIGNLAPQTTAALDIAQSSDSPDGAQRHRIRIELDRIKGEDGYDLALTSFDRKANDRSQELRETLVIHRLPTGDQDHLALAVPMTFAASPATGLVIDISIDTRPADAQSIADFKTRLDASAAPVAQKLKTSPADAADLDISAALDELARSNNNPRATLAYLAQMSGAQLSESVVLVADTQLLTLISKGVREAIPRLPSRNRLTVGWMLDRATINTVSSLKEDQAARMLPPVQGVLETFAGEAGYELDVLKSLANKSTSSGDLYNHLIAEHLIYLEDNSTSARVRAFDWLKARNAAPPGYDPLAPNRARRDALDKFQEATTQPAQ